MNIYSNAQTEQPQQTYQEAITRIQEIVRLLETGDIEVDELTQLIEEATGLIQFCSTRLTSIDKEVSQLLQQLDESPKE
ncbi:exodeoxyribonuclease VII small subunit [Porphyromonas sp.]|uniref:exodeoxyribonuclease VII small subunit n=1 Tax=Porphyromonas sp. TaxID=1924944 RepID=UPI003A90D055